MKTISLINCLALWALLSTLNPQLSAAPLGTAFTYQGRLSDGTNAAAGLYDFRFAVFDDAANGTPVGPVLTNAASVTGGLFTTVLDFGPGVFTGSARWLEIGVRPNGASADFTTLAPRQQLTPVPYALMANSASNLLGTLPATQLSGIVPLAQLPDALVTNNQPSVTLGSLTLGGNLNLPQTTATNGAIYGRSALLLHDYGALNFFAGLAAGNLTMTGTENTGLGAGALQSDTTGSGNSALGCYALRLNTIGNNNTALGDRALYSNVSGYDNTAVGRNALNSNTGSFNTAVGSAALSLNTSGANNTASGTYALQYNTAGDNNTASGYGALSVSRTGHNNTADGSKALNANTSGSGNTALGYMALWLNTTGNNNLALGYQAGLNLNTGSDNIAVGNRGVAGESQTIRLGTAGTHTNTFIAGIYSNTVPTGLPVYVDATGQLGTGSGSPVALLNSNQTFTGAVTFNNAAGNFSGTFSGNGAGLTNLSAAQVNAWSTTGNAGTDPSVNFIGTTDNQPLEFRVNNLRALHLQPSIPEGTLNLVGGSPVNLMAPGVYGSVIVGGGARDYYGWPSTNSVSASMSFLGGGCGNSIEPDAEGSFLGGG